MKFSGAEYEAEHDHKRLAGQLGRIFELMEDGQWRTLAEIAIETVSPESSVSAQLRNLRKPENGAHTIERRVKGDRSQGLFEYKLIPNLNPSADIPAKPPQFYTVSQTDGKTSHTTAKRKNKDLSPLKRFEFDGIGQGHLFQQCGEVIL